MVWEVVLPEGWEKKCTCQLCGEPGRVPIITLEGFLCQDCAEESE